jgi:hypothetical protein
MNLDKERRRSNRKPTCFDILLFDEKGKSAILKAVNQSESGLYVLSKETQRPTLGSLVQVSLNELETNEGSSLLNMLVTRIDCDGLGLKYVEFINN